MNWANSPDLPIWATSIGAWQSATRLWRKKPQKGQESRARWARSEPSCPQPIIALRTSVKPDGIFFSLLGQGAGTGRRAKLIGCAPERITSPQWWSVGYQWELARPAAGPQLVVNASLLPLSTRIFGAANRRATTAGRGDVHDVHPVNSRRSTVVLPLRENSRPNTSNRSSSVRGCFRTQSTASMRAIASGLSSPSR